MKYAIVTGGTKGIGLNIVKTLLSSGYYVYATYAADAVAANNAESELLSINSLFSIHKVNHSSSDEIHQFAASITHPIDCIVCYAGTTIRKTTSEITDQEWNNMMQVNVNSHFYLIRDLWQQIEPTARIIFIGSLMAIHPHATSLPYAVAKAALHAMAKNLVKDFDGTQVTVNVIAPGFVDTDWQKNKPEEIRNNICQKTALHRFASPEEIASVVQFLIDNPFINGEVIEVSGGYNYR